MNSDVECFLQCLKLQVAATTFSRKQLQLRAFERYFASRNKLPAETTKLDIESYLISLRTTTLYRRQVCCCIREFYEYLKTPDNPASKIVFKKDASRKLPRVPSLSFIEAILSKYCNIDKETSFRDRLILELAYGSGLRRAELVKLDIEDINLEEKTLFIHGKGGNKRIVPITAKALESMREYLSIRQAYNGALLVSARGKRLGSSGVYYILREKAGIRPHLLRHACASHMLKNGCSIRVIQQLLGHKKLCATQIYTQIQKADLREVINKKHPGNNNNHLKLQ